MIRKLKSGGYRLYSRKVGPKTDRRRNLGRVQAARKRPTPPRHRGKTALRRKASPRRPTSGTRRTSSEKATRSARKTEQTRRWSQHVTEHSDALDLETSIFKSSDPRRIALSLKRSAERSKRRKSGPYRSAMSMLVFYINRAGRGLSRRRARILERAKDELRRAFGRA